MAFYWCESVLYPYHLYVASVAILDDYSDYNFEGRHPNDDSGQLWLKVTQWFQKIYSNSLRQTDGW